MCCVMKVLFMYLVDLHILPAILDPLVSSVGFAPVGLLLFVIAVAAFTTETGRGL